MSRKREFYDPDAYPVADSVGFMIRRLNVSMARAIEARVARYGLTDAQWAPLTLLHHGRVRTARELAEVLDVNPGAMTRMIDRLEAKGLIRRTPCAVDRRRVLLDVTPAGERAAAHVPAALAAANNAHLDGFTLEEFRALDALLRRMLANDPSRRQA